MHVCAMHMRIYPHIFSNISTRFSTDLPISSTTSPSNFFKYSICFSKSKSDSENLDSFPTRFSIGFLFSISDSGSRSGSG
nr:MAG TPA: hypothetical protein [Caudoviricetes sp.]